MKAHHLAVLVVMIAVAAAVALTGVPTASKSKTTKTAATRVDPDARRPELPPFAPLEGPLWDLPSVDARLQLPKGWQIGHVGPDQRVMRDESDPLAGNINLLLMPNPFGFTVEELLSENTDELAVNPDLKLEDRRELYVQGRKILRFDYNGTPRGGEEPVRFVALVWPRGRFQVVLTTTIRAKHWAEVAVDVEAALESLQIRWPLH